MTPRIKKLVRKLANEAAWSLRRSREDGHNSFLRGAARGYILAAKAVVAEFRKT